MKRVHIVGISPRSGTSLMALAMSYCCNVDLTSSKEENIFRYEPDPRKRGILLTKNPQDIRVVKPSLRVDPNLYVICMIRDPRDCTVSTHGSCSNKYWVSMKVWRDNKMIYDELKNLPKVINVKYEKLVKSPDHVQSELVDKVPFLEKKYLFSNYHNIAENSDYYRSSLGRVRPIKPDSVGKWKKHLPRVKEQIEKHPEIIDYITQMGYENSISWVEKIGSVRSGSFKNGYKKDGYYYKRDFYSVLKKYTEMMVRLSERFGTNSSSLKEKISKTIPQSYKPLGDPIVPSIKNETGQNNFAKR